MVRSVGNTPLSWYQHMPYYDERPDRKQIGRICLTLLHYCSPSREVRIGGTHTGLDPGCRGHRGVLFTGLFLMASSDCLIIVARTTSPGVAPLTMGWALSNQSLIKKIPYKLCRAQCQGGIFSTEAPSSLISIACVKLT